MLKATLGMATLRMALVGLIPLMPQKIAAEQAGFAPVAAAMAEQDWDMAYALADAAGPVGRDLVTWTRLRAGSGSFAEYEAFLEVNGHWPGLAGLRARAEEAIPEGLDPDRVLAFFETSDPQTGQGVVRLAEAHIALGKDAEARSALADAWVGLGLNDEGFAALIEAFGDVLSEHHAARADAMLWRWRTSDAARLLPLLDPDQRALVEARIAFISNTPDRIVKLDAVPAGLKDHPGLAYDRFNRLANGGDYTDAIALLSERSTSAEALGEPFRWASWRAMLARWTMREGRPDQAYQLASRHFLTEGEMFADLEWLAGYVALTYLDRPETALAHFAAVEAAASGGITLARAGYWQGRALEALGRWADASQAYGRAAQHQTAFYGLLAAERLEQELDPALTGLEPFDWRGASFLTGDLAQAMLLLLAANERGTAVLFVAELARTLDREGVGQLGALLAAMDEPFLTVLVGKAAADRGILLPAVYFPMHPLAEMELPVEPALALSIARRESEFNHVVASPVGALGLMQVMPATAEEVAGRLGLPYSRARLTSDWRYNATLGAQYLAELEEMFGKSPVLVAAGYNAGPSRPRTWMGQRGDPRRDGMDVVDWIEHIPFTETRNYVMRVTESIPAYRARISGETGPIAFRELLIGAPPVIRPVARQDSPSAPAVAEDQTAAPAMSGAPLRPQARPGG